VALTEGLAAHAGDRVDVLDSHAGMHLVAWLRDYDDARCARLVEHARAHGLGLYPIAPYYLDPPMQAGLLLGYAGLAPAEISTAMRLFGACLREV
jgi:GntR family transcriptional regulator/MocR family aminotransferase